MKMGFLDRTEFTVRKLEPKTGNKKGVIDLILFKNHMADYLVDSFMTRANFVPEVKTEIRAKTMTHSAYRELVCGYPAKEGADVTMRDLSWKKGWPRSGELMLRSDLLLQDK